MSNITVFVKARPGAAGIMVERRCRCGMCFDTVGRTVSVTEDQLVLLQADPMLVVTDAPAPESDAEVTEDQLVLLQADPMLVVTDAPAPESDAEVVEVVETAAVVASEGDTPKVEASAKIDKNAAKADKRAG